jgi:hypothetical protein
MGRHASLTETDDELLTRELQHGDVVTSGPFAIQVRSDPDQAGPGATVVTD